MIMTRTTTTRTNTTTNSSSSSSGGSHIYIYIGIPIKLVTILLFGIMGVCGEKHHGRFCLVQRNPETLTRDGSGEFVTPKVYPYRRSTLRSTRDWYTGLEHGIGTRDWNTG